MFDYNDNNSTVETIYKYLNPLGDLTNFGTFSADQSKLIVTSSADILYVNMKEPDASKREIYFDDKEEIAEIRNVFATKDKFYVLANNKDNKLGFCLFSIGYNDPFTNSLYFIRWNNKLDIGNADMFFMTESVGDENDEVSIKEYVVVSYKCIGINTFNVFVFDLEDKLIKYWFEGYQLWESPMKGFLLTTNDFLVLSKDGISMVALGTKESRQIKDKEGQWRMVHSLGKCNYLKIEPTNHLLFAMQFHDDR